MSLKAMTWAMEDSGVTSNSQWSVLMVLANRANNDEPTCFPGQETIAREARLSVRTVRTALAALEEAGLITRKERRRADGSRSSDEYRVNIGVSYRQTLPVAEQSPANEGEVTGNHYRGVPATIARQEPVSLNQEENLSEGANTSPVNMTSNSRRSYRGSRVDENFYVNAELREWSAAEVPSVAIDQETLVFIDYWKGVPGVRGLKSDWVSTWKNWMRKAHKEELRRGWKPTQRYRMVGEDFLVAR